MDTPTKQNIENYISEKMIELLDKHLLPKTFNNQDIIKYFDKIFDVFRANYFEQFIDDDFISLEEIISYDNDPTKYYPDFIHLSLITGQDFGCYLNSRSGMHYLHQFSELFIQDIYLNCFKGNKLLLLEDKNNIVTCISKRTLHY